jgi:hypothetical protein
MVVEVYEVIERFAAVVEALGDPYVRADDPFDPGASPSPQTRAFSVMAPQTLANGTRDRDGSQMQVSTRIVVRVQCPLDQAGPSRVAYLTSEVKAEPQLVRALLVQGEAWAAGLRVSYAGTERSRLPDGWSQTDHAFDVRHAVSL